MFTMDDLRDSLSQIVRTQRKSLIELILEIQEKKIERADFLSNFLNQLECFFFDPNNNTILRRKWIRALENGAFVALSYTWGASNDEDKSSGRYFIENRSRDDFFRSPVRNSIFRRVAKYMRSRGVDLLWIDRHSLPQQTCKNECVYDHQACRRKMDGLQSMDWVYRLSEYPVALLGRPIKTETELSALYSVLTGEFIYPINGTTNFRLSNRMDHRQAAKEALILLHAITNDLWWQRAWTFQENYKGGDAMVLLISHPRICERLKLTYDIFGDIPGEICIESSNFSRQATRLCLALQQSGQITQQERAMINAILRSAKRYTVLLDDSSAMTPSIVADVCARGVKDSWDRLPIIANCCDYPRRLDVRKLQRDNQSLSVSILASCLLNGELFCDEGSDSGLQSNVCDFLERHILKTTSPLQIERRLTFKKGVRFNAVTLTNAGVQTNGHLWELGPIIQTSQMGYPVRSMEDSGACGIDPQDYYHLMQLSNDLQTRSHHSLAGELQRYLHLDEEGNRPYQIGEDYMLLMAIEVARAVGDGRSIRLGRIWNPQGRPNAFTAAFIWDVSASEDPVDDSNLVFTSLEPQTRSSVGHDANDVHRHVSVLVTIQGIDEDGGYTPYLRSERGVLGMCFFKGVQKVDVVFPWPLAFEQTVP